MVKFFKKDDKTTVVEFWGFSIDYGGYNSRLLEKFKENIQEALQEDLEVENVEVVIHR